MLMLHFHSQVSKDVKDTEDEKRKLEEELKRKKQEKLDRQKEKERRL